MGMGTVALPQFGVGPIPEIEIFPKAAHARTINAMGKSIVNTLYNTIVYSQPRCRDKGKGDRFQPIATWLLRHTITITERCIDTAMTRSRPTRLEPVGLVCTAHDGPRSSL